MGAAQEISTDILTTPQVAPDDPFPHLAFAELLIDKGRKVDAVQHLKRARNRIHRDSALTALLEKLEAKTARAVATPQQAKATAPQKQSAKPVPLPEQSVPRTEPAGVAPTDTVEPAPVAEPIPPADPASNPIHTVPAPAEPAS